MTEIKYHLTDGLLMGYATGNLPEAFSLVVATHISLCDECRARLGSFEAVGGALIEEDDMAKAAIRGVAKPAIANGTAMILYKVAI